METEDGLRPSHVKSSSTSASKALDAKQNSCKKENVKSKNSQVLSQQAAKADGGLAKADARADGVRRIQ
jgi:hypothetical protein